MKRAILSIFTLIICLTLVVPVGVSAKNKQPNLEQWGKVRVYNNGSVAIAEGQGFGSPLFPESDTLTQEQSASSFNSISPESTGSAGYIEFALLFYPVEGASQVQLNWRVSNIVGDEPDVVYLELGLYGRVTRDYGDYTLTGSHKYVTLYNPDVGDNGTETVNISSTKYYIMGARMVAYEDGVFVGSASYATSNKLLNKKATLYPYHFDPYAGKEMHKPERTDWASTTPISWNRSAYITWYNTTYPNHGWDWSNTEVHHIRPRSYGGTNDYSNLIPIPTTKHWTVTAWWNYY